MLYGKEICCDCNHEAPAADTVSYAGMLFCSEGCRDAYIERYALAEDFKEYVLVEGWEEFLSYVVANNEVLRDNADCILPFGEVMEEIYSEFCLDMNEEFAEWEEDRIAGRLGWQGGSAGCK